jgi:YVTN family beta-propeller protein
MLKRLMGLSISAAAAALVAICQGASAETAATPVLYVDNSTDDTISVINVLTRKNIATIKVGDRPHAVCVQEDGRKVYTTTEVDYTLVAIDTATNAVSGTVKLPADPNECAVTKDGNYVVVPLRGNNTAVIIDSKTNQIVKTLPIKGPHNCVAPMGGSNDYIYCEEQRGFDIAKIDMKTMEIADRIKVNGEARPFLITPDQKTMYVALSALSGFASVDLATDMITEVVLPPTHGNPCTIEPGNTPTHGIALTPDLKKLWITDIPGSGVYVYDVATKKLSEKISVGKCPNWFAITSDGKYVAITNAESNSVSIIDAKTQKVLGDEIPVGKGPKRIDVVNVPAPAT